MKAAAAAATSSPVFKGEACLMLPRHRAKACGFLVYSSLTLIPAEWIAERHSLDTGMDLGKTMLGSFAFSSDGTPAELWLSIVFLFCFARAFPNPILMQIKWSKHLNEVAVIMIFMIKDGQLLLSKVVFSICTLESGNGPV